MKVCHFSSVHDAKDVRVFVKECKSLAAAGFEVYLVSCGEPGERMIDGVHVIGMGEAPKSRRKRMTSFARQVYEKALALDCALYHFHDPELLPFGLKLKKKGKKVVFDSHEDIPAQIMDKVWIRPFIRKIVSSAYSCMETYSVKRLDAVVAATPYIRDRFAGRARIAVDINNFPRMDDISIGKTPIRDRESLVCYAGGINELRGEKIMLEAMKRVEGRLVLAGVHEPLEIGNVSYVGRLDRAGINDLYGRAVAGLCVLKPITNYINSQPVKMYEYMAAGIPFICSDFPKWREVAEKSGAGLCVDPSDAESVSRAISELLHDRDKAQTMGKKGYEYLIHNCLWDREGEKLTALYRQLLNTDSL